MESALAITAWNPLKYCSPWELSQLDERFDIALQNVPCLVFWTGISPELARCWADQHGLPTLTIAMGPLYTGHDEGSVRCGKSSKGWSKYMKGASGRFAEYACRDGRRALVLTNPPPNTYSTRGRSNYRDLEEPILKGAVGKVSTARIEYVHPSVDGGAAFLYQTWPLDESINWYTFLTKILSKTPINCDHASVEDQVTAGPIQIHLAGVQLHNRPCELSGSAETTLIRIQEKKEDQQKSRELGHRIAYERRKGMQRMTGLNQSAAREKTEINRKRAELEQRVAQEKKEAKKKRAALEQQRARETKETKRRRVELEQRVAQERKEAKRRRAALEQRIAQEKKEAKRVQVEMEWQHAQEQKQAG